MLTPFTQIALTTLHDISCGENGPRCGQYAFSVHSQTELLNRLECAGLIRLLPDKQRGELVSYDLTRPLTNISLLDVLNAINEHLDYSIEATEQMYQQYGIAARKLGVVNYVIRRCLSDIKLIDLPTRIAYPHDDL